MTALPQIRDREDIVCPGDTLPYMCSIRSNSETIVLNWQITFPGQDTIIMIIFTNETERSVVKHLPMNLTASLTKFEIDEDVESVLVLTVLQGVTLDGTLLECRSGDLASKNKTVYINTSGKFKNNEFPVFIFIFLQYP